MTSRVISFQYTLKDPQGETLDASEPNEPMSYLEGRGQIIPGLESELKKMAVGDKRKIKVEAKNAYGAHDPKNVIEIERDKLPTQKVNVGDRFRAGNDASAPVVRVTKVGEKQVTLDANHPLAGMDLTFDVEITEIRDATDEEMAHGHAHGPGGHHHH